MRVAETTCLSKDRRERPLRSARSRGRAAQNAATWPPSHLRKCGLALLLCGPLTSVLFRDKQVKGL